MTINQMLHHGEQTDAMREEFLQLFEKEIIPFLQSLPATEREVFIAEHCAWVAFRKARRSK